MPRQGLTRAQVVAEAEAAADEVGLERLTLAAVAKRLDVKLPSLYNHVQGVEGLRRELSLKAAQELTARLQAVTVGRAGRDAVVELARAYRVFGHERPSLFASAQRAPDPLDDELAAAGDAVLGVMLAALAGYGLTGDDAVDAIRALRALLLGWVTLETSDGFRMDRGVDDSFERMLAGFDAALTRQPTG